jgi:hypothetical protein
LNGSVRWDKDGLSGVGVMVFVVKTPREQERSSSGGRESEEKRET